VRCGGWSVGDRLISVLGFGGMAEKIVIPARSAFRLPPSAASSTAPRCSYLRDQHPCVV
jgi:NADPH:quinone reductase-like Zn-dependent oxidoreductase